MKNRNDFLSDARALESITEGDTEDLKLCRIGGRLSPTTVHKRLQSARMLLRDATRRGPISESPFPEVRSKPANLRDRHRFISRQGIDRLMAVCDPTWQLFHAMRGHADSQRDRACPRSGPFTRSRPDSATPHPTFGR